MTRQPRRRPSFWRLLLWSPLFLCGAACLGLALFFFVPMGLSSALAHRLAPPPYPGSQLLEQWQSGGPDTMWDRSTWQTSASVAEVVAHMEAHLPPLTVDDEGRYRSGLCDEGALSQWAAYQINGGHYPSYTWGNVPLPCASVKVYAAPDVIDRTEYQIWIDWPAP